MATAKPTIPANATYGTDAGGSVSFNLPTGLQDGQRVLLFITHVASGTISQSSGVTFTNRAGSSFGSVGLTLETWYRDVTPSDDNAAITFANTSSTTTWEIILLVIDGGKRSAAFFDQEGQALVAGGGATTITSTSVTPSVADTLLLTIASYSVVATATTDSYGATTSGGATDTLLVEKDATSAAATRNRGIAVYPMATSPTSGVGTATRTCTVTNTSNHACLSLVIAPEPFAQCDLNQALPFGLTAAGSVQVTAAFDKALPFGFASTIQPPLEFDAAVESVRTGTTDPHTWTHTPVRTPRAIVVTAIHGTSSTSHVTSVTYGGVAMTRVREAADTATEPGRADTWFLGAGIPTGNQTVSVDLSSATTDDIHFVSMSFTAGGDCEVVDHDAVQENATDPQVTLQYGGRRCIAVAALYGGGPAPSSYTSLANQTRVHDEDLGAFAAMVDRQTAAGTSDFTIGYTAGTDDVALAAFAFAEIPPRTADANVVLPLSLTAAGSVQVTAAFDKLLFAQFSATASVQVTGALSQAVPFGFSSDGSTQVSIAASFNNAIPFAIAAAGSVQVTAALSQAVPFALATAASVQVTAAFSQALPFGESSSGSVQVTAAVSKALPFSLASAGSVQVTAALAQPVPFSLATAASVQVTASFNKALPFGFSSDGSAIAGVAGTFNQSLPFGFVSSVSVQVTGALARALPFGFSSDAVTVVRLAFFDNPLPLLLTATLYVERPHHKFTDVSHSLGRSVMKQIDLNRDYTFQVDVTQPSPITGNDEPASGITGWTSHLALSSGGVAVHADLTKNLVERSGTAGRYYSQFDQTDMDAHLANYEGHYAWVVVTKAGDVATKSFKRLLVRGIDDDDT